MPTRSRRHGSVSAPSRPQLSELASEVIWEVQPCPVELAGRAAGVSRVVELDRIEWHVLQHGTALAGALGVPVWTLLPWPADWRWLEHRPDGPWYPSMRLFRQSCECQGDRAPVLRELAAALLDLTLRA